MFAGLERRQCEVTSLVETGVAQVPWLSGVSRQRGPGRALEETVLSAEPMHHDGCIIGLKAEGSFFLRVSDG